MHGGMLGRRFIRYLLATTAIVVFAAPVGLARAADIDPAGNADYPSAFISFEGGVVFDGSKSNMSFAEDDDKLGELGSLQPGDWGGEGRFTFGQQLHNDWDYRVGVAAIFLGEDTSSAKGAEASQKTSLQTLDVEIGYRPGDLGALQTRLFAGVRGLHSATTADWSHNSEDDKFGRSGEFNDDVYAIGPRIGADLLIPLSASNVALVGSASGSVLLGNAESAYRYEGIDSELTRSISSETVWNAEAMAGVSFGVGERAELTLGYRAAQFWNVMADRSDIKVDGSFNEDGRSDLLVHGPFARLTVDIP